jgi:hypothetical protein
LQPLYNSSGQLLAIAVDFPVTGAPALQKAMEIRPGHVVELCMAKYKFNNSISRLATAAFTDHYYSQTT